MYVLFFGEDKPSFYKKVRDTEFQILPGIPAYKKKQKLKETVKELLLCV